ncbi:MAG: hypothetical protein V3U79_08685 [Dehalococcoidia bacterium]
MGDTPKNPRQSRQVPSIGTSRDSTPPLEELIKRPQEMLLENGYSLDEIVRLKDERVII